MSDRGPIERSLLVMLLLFLMVVLGLVALVATFFAAPAPAEAQVSNCADHAVVAERLAVGWGESRQAIGIGADGRVVETYANLATGSWTITVSAPDGPTCVVASGEAFQLLGEPLVQGEPT